MQAIDGVSQVGTGPGWTSAVVPPAGGSSAVQFVFGTSSESARADEAATKAIATTRIERRPLLPIPAPILAPRGSPRAG
jgi:hypothetical protein